MYKTFCYMKEYMPFVLPFGKDLSTVSQDKFIGLALWRI